MNRTQAVASIVEAYGKWQGECSGTVEEDITILTAMFEALAAFGVTIDDVLDVEGAGWVATTMSVAAELGKHVPPLRPFGELPPGAYAVDEDGRVTQDGVLVAVVGPDALAAIRAPWFGHLSIERSGDQPS